MCLVWLHSSATIGNPIRNVGSNLDTSQRKVLPISHRRVEGQVRLSSESTRTSPTYLCGYEDSEQLCLRLTRRKACGPNACVQSSGKRASREPLLMAVQGLTCVGVCASSQSACIRVTTHSAPHTKKTGTHNRHRCTQCTVQHKHTETRVSCARST